MKVMVRVKGLCEALRGVLGGMGLGLGGKPTRFVKRENAFIFKEQLEHGGTLTRKG